MDQHIRCYRSERTGESHVLSSCPCTCHDRYASLPTARADWIDHNGHPCDDWIRAQFILEQRQVDIYQRTGRPAGERLTAEQLALVGEQPSRNEQYRRLWHQLTGRESSW